MLQRIFLFDIFKQFSGIPRGSTTIRLRTFRLRHFVYKHFVYDTSSIDISSTDISSTDISSTDISSTTVYQHNIFFSLFVIVLLVVRNRRRSDVVAHWPLASLSTRAYDLRTFVVALFCRRSHVGVLLSCAHLTGHLSDQMRI